jgi:single-strand selective monofunctional uracil DNA glycosylase
MSELSQALMKAASKMNRKLNKVELPDEVAYVYNPFDYARPMIEAYYDLAAKRGKKKVMLVGMNPGPWGMAQTGVPFGEVNLVRDWMKLDAKIGRPKKEHEKRPVLGLQCTRSEVSGARLWGAVAERYPKARDFFKDHFVANWCPLLFLEAGAKNIPPDKFRKATREALAEACDVHLATMIDLLEPEWLVGVGAFARKAAERGLERSAHEAKVGTVLHPSPASPKANRGWREQAQKELAEQGVPAFL